MPLVDVDRHDPLDDASRLVYFSSVSNNTHRFVQRLGVEEPLRIPLYERRQPMLVMDTPYLLLVPTYGGGSARGAVPKQVIHFLNNPVNRGLIRGVVTSGNRNFGSAYCAAGPQIALRCGVPELYRFELLGTAADVRAVRAILAGMGVRLQQQSTDSRKSVLS